MSRQDKATTERFAKTLRELVKKPENKTCADCKRNDPRWASWNIGVFLCIRCSGIHRGMGTHISKVKSVDLDVWTPEQMESILKWGNHLANLYWEAHLKPGHVPPEHKMESFVRSKYESRRWALEGPPPIDPTTLENRSASPPPSPPHQQQPQQPPSQPRQPTSLPGPTHVPNNISSQSTITTRQPQARQLISAGYTNAQRQASANIGTRSVIPAAPVPAPTPPPQQPKAPENDLFSLDFHAPTTPSTSIDNNSASQYPKKDVKQDILSLFSAPPAAAPSAFGQFGSNAASPWGNVQQQQQQHVYSQQPTSMIGNNGAGAWGASSGWTGTPAATVVPPAQGDLWGTPAGPADYQSQHKQPNLFDTNAVWGAPAPSTAPNQDLFGAPFGSAPAQKKDDVFGDIWGGFK